jgi:hypothetical protein
MVRRGHLRIAIMFLGIFRGQGMFLKKRKSVNFFHSTVGHRKEGNEGRG